MVERRILYFIFITVILLLLNSPIRATDMGADTIMHEMKEALEPGISCTRKMVFTLKNHDKITNTWIAREARKKLADGKMMLFVILEPDEAKGVARLVCERENRTSIEWMYFPAMKRVVKMAPVMAYDSFQGTDFTCSDIGFINIRGTHKLLGEEEHSGNKTYKVETIPENKGYYSRIITWVSTESFLPLERDYYDVVGILWKTMFFENAVVINNTLTPIRVRMIDVQAETSTEYEVSDVCYGANIPDETFRPGDLPDALNAPFCHLPMGGYRK
ncbi:conserved hypothetical protein [uncultured Desulfobacterium sp.]|uniref:Uncharacterized protein TP-0789 domain-containing protein n=1 Tax=uncultured Desulfobacterium sp. TaxID=201089 RepID=A0A445N3Z3_9BACT|nr:conserved hypothetical protein [uncultured Desulfobacterium sp.]